MIGDGSLFEEVKSLLKEEGLENDIVLSGYQKNSVSAMKGVDMLCLTSENEGFGMVVLEAMAAAKPVVSFDVGGVRNLIVEAESGFLIPFPDVEKMAEKLFTLLQSPELMLKIGKKGEIEAGAYTMPVMVQRLENLYDKID